MEESTSWKGHSFTLLVFAGIVVLCSVFFVLGMMVGRSQVSAEPVRASASPPEAKDRIVAEAPPAEPQLRPAASSREAKARTKAQEKEQAASDDSELRPPPSPPPPARQEPAPSAKPATRASYYQVSAFKQVKDAEKMVADLRGKGFTALIVSPATGDPNPFYRVQVGPLNSQDEVTDAQARLQAAGFKPILRK